MTTAGPYAPALIAQICREIEKLGEEHFAQMAVSPERVRGAQQSVYGLIERYGRGPVQAAVQVLEAQLNSKTP